MWQCFGARLLRMVAYVGVRRPAKNSSVSGHPRLLVPLLPSHDRAVPACPWQYGTSLSRLPRLRGKLLSESITLDFATEA